MFFPSVGVGYCNDASVCVCVCVCLCKASQTEGYSVKSTFNHSVWFAFLLSQFIVTRPGSLSEGFRHS